MPTNPTQQNPQKLRHDIRQQRAHLTTQTQQQLSRKIARQLYAHRIFRNARHIAIYIPVRGEADPRFLHRWALPHQQFYLPVLSPFGDSRLWFVRWDKHTRFHPNRFRIPEPLLKHRHSRPARWLDLVVTPLVAYDHSGNRLGMGGGFYDRTFAFKRALKHQPRPHLAGYAYAFQRSGQLVPQSWDVTLNSVFCESGFFDVKH